MTNTSKKKRTKRNDALIDKWSAIHFVTALSLAALFGPLLALLATTLWEPIEIFVLSPALDKFGILFGHETLKNSLSDIIFNTLGVLVAALIF